MLRFRSTTARSSNDPVGVAKPSKNSFYHTMMHAWRSSGLTRTLPKALPTGCAARHAVLRATSGAADNDRTAPSRVAGKLQTPAEPAASGAKTPKPSRPRPAAEPSAASGGAGAPAIAPGRRRPPRSQRPATAAQGESKHHKRALPEGADGASDEEADEEEDELEARRAQDAADARLTRSLLDGEADNDSWAPSSSKCHGLGSLPRILN